MTVTTQQEASRPRVLPGIVILCLYLALSLFQNGMVLRVALNLRHDAAGTELARLGELAVTFTLIELAAAFVSIALLVLVRRAFVPYFVAAALLFCSLPGHWLQNLVLSAFQSDQPVLGTLTALALLDFAIALVGAVWLLKSRNVRDFFNHRLLPQTFA